MTFWILMDYCFITFNCYGCPYRSIPVQERSRAVAVVFGGLSFGSVLGYVFSGILWYICTLVHNSAR